MANCISPDALEDPERIRERPMSWRAALAVWVSGASASWGLIVWAASAVI